MSRSGAGSSAEGPDLSQVTARKNLNETAFFFPQLMSDQNGVVQLQFTMPEALTQWRFMGFAHDKQIAFRFPRRQNRHREGPDGAAESAALPARRRRAGVHREGFEPDRPTRQQGKVRLTFNDARREQAADELLGNADARTELRHSGQGIAQLLLALKVPDGAAFLTYKAVGSTGNVSDGEEGYLPVLSRRIFVTESLPLPIRGRRRAGRRSSSSRSCSKSGQVRLRCVHQNLTVQMVSNPSWYAVLALPYLMEFPHECTEQTFNRLYANALARHIANSDPKIRRVFDQWKGTPALDSPLEKNQDLKSVMIEETPWLRQAQQRKPGAAQCRHSLRRQPAR